MVPQTEQSARFACAHRCEHWGVKQVGADNYNIGDNDDDGSSGAGYDSCSFWASKPKPSKAPDHAVRQGPWDRVLSEESDTSGDQGVQHLPQSQPPAGPQGEAAPWPPASSSWNAALVQAPGAPGHVAPDRMSSDSEATVAMANQEEVLRKMAPRRGAPSARGPPR